MAICKTWPTRNIVATVNYCKSSKNGDYDKERVLLAGGYKCSFESLPTLSLTRMMGKGLKANRQNIEGYHRIISFDSSELPLYTSDGKISLESVEKAKEIALAEAEELAEPMAYFIHGDRDNLHIHEVTLSVRSDGSAWDKENLFSSQKARLKRAMSKAKVENVLDKNPNKNIEEQMRINVLVAIQKSTNLDDYIANIRESGIEIDKVYSKSGKVNKDFRYTMEAEDEKGVKRQITRKGWAFFDGLEVDKEKDPDGKNNRLKGERITKYFEDLRAGTTTFEKSFGSLPKSLDNELEAEANEAEDYKREYRHYPLEEPAKLTGLDRKYAMKSFRNKADTELWLWKEMLKDGFKPGDRLSDKHQDVIDYTNQGFTIDKAIELAKSPEKRVENREKTKDSIKDKGLPPITQIKADKKTLKKENLEDEFEKFFGEKFSEVPMIEKSLLEDEEDDFFEDDFSDSFFGTTDIEKKMELEEKSDEKEVEQGASHVEAVKKLDEEKRDMKEFLRKAEELARKYDELYKDDDGYEY